MKQFLGIAISLLLTYSAGVAAQQTDRETISVTASGTVELVPNAFAFDVVIEERGERVSDLNQKASASVQRIVRFLVTRGVNENSITSMDVNLQPWIEHSQSKGRENKGYILTRVVSVTHDNIEDFDNIIDGVTKNSINRVQSFKLLHKSEENYAHQALINAVKEAKLKASLVANELDVKLGEVVAVNLLNANSPSPMFKTKAVSEFAQASLPGTQTHTADVAVVFEIQN